MRVISGVTKGFPSLSPPGQKPKSKIELSLLLASHNMREVERLCDNVVMMKKGSIVDQGTCQELINKHGRSDLEETFLKIARGNKL